MSRKESKLYRNVADAVMGQPETCDELLHKYGTYEIQPTSDSDNEFPEISQGLSEREKDKSVIRRKGVLKKEKSQSSQSESL